MSSEIPRGRFVWHELMTSDPTAAQSFYTQLIGWSTQVWDGGPTPYTMWMNGETAVGGLMSLPEEAKQQGAPPHWLAYIATPDVDATAAAEAGRGGRLLHGPFDIETVGRTAVLMDPQGAVFAAHTAAGTAPGHDGPWGVGEISWHELATTDPDSPVGFYSDLFGWVKTDAMDMGPAGTDQMFGRTNDRSVGGIFRKAIETVTQLGGQVLNGPMDVPGGDRVAQCMDPQGVAFAIHSTAKTSG